MKDPAELLAGADAVLLDFDGPVTPLMPSPVNAHAAEAARAALRRNGVTPPDEIATTTDHLAVLRWAGEYATPALGDVETACTDAEVAAALTCTPTPGAHECLAAWQQVNKPVVIVSNNAAEAVHAYLDRHDLAEYVRGVIGRPVGHPELMKPDARPVDEALLLLGAESKAIAMIGDSVSDIEVARMTHVTPIGYAKSETRGNELVRAGAEAITSSMDRLFAVRG